jgi:DNA-binding PadR family transcriptional regulator
MERDGKLRCEERPSENNRQARYYTLTPSGRKHLESEEQRWERVTAAIASVLQGA